MNELEWQLIHGFAAMIEKQPREGALIDMPEGARTLKFTLSDTFANRITMAMRQCAGELERQLETITDQAIALEALRNQVNLITEPQIIIPGNPNR